MSWTKNIIYRINKYSNWIVPIILLLLSTIVIGNITSLPNQTIWDETYYLPAIQKYKDGTFFMESHPPLGKLILTTGEVLISPNGDYNSLNWLARLCMSNTIIDDNGIQRSLLNYRNTYPNAIELKNLNEYNNINDSNKLPLGYSFCGVRFMPALFAIFIPLLIYLIMNLMVNNKYLSFFIASLAIFDNALLTHYRATMIDGIQMVFILSSIYLFFKIIKSKQFQYNTNWFLMLLFIAFAIATKHNAVFLLMFPLLLVSQISNYKSILKLLISYSFIFLIYFGIFMVHIDNGRNFVANSQDKMGYYNADDKTKEYLSKTSYEFNHLNIFRSNFEYMQNYHLRVPLLDPTNPNENGSYPYQWPFMKKIIQYNSQENKKLMLVGNPIIWALSLIAVILTIFNLARVAGEKEIAKNIYYQYLALVFLIYFIYYSTMFVSSNLRVMYLYHYLVSFIISFLLLGLIIKLNNWDTKANIPVFIFLGTCIIGFFILVSPYTYYLPTNQSYFLNKLF
jgi:dolichyl-phosphate-mannose-protein mannosyltransferase